MKVEGSVSWFGFWIGMSIWQAAYEIAKVL